MDTWKGFGRLGVINCHSNPRKGRTVVITTISEDFTVLLFLFFGGYYKLLFMSGGDPLLGLPVSDIEEYTNRMSNMDTAQGKDYARFFPK